MPHKTQSVKKGTEVLDSNSDLFLRLTALAHKRLSLLLSIPECYELFHSKISSRISQGQSLRGLLLGIQIRDGELIRRTPENRDTVNRHVQDALWELMVSVQKLGAGESEAIQLDAFSLNTISRFRIHSDLVAELVTAAKKHPAVLSPKYLKSAMDDVAHVEQELIAGNMGLVHSALNAHFPSHLSINGDDSDLLSSGMYGLLVAIKTFIPELGFKFSTHACRHILARMLQELKSKSPVYLDSQSELLLAKYRSLIQEKPTIRDMDAARLLDCQLSDIGRLRCALEPVDSMDKVFADGDGTLHCMIPDDSLSPEVSVARSDTHNSLYAAIIESLSERNREIFIDYKGLFGNPELNSTELAAKYGLTPTRIRQIVQDCMKKLSQSDTLNVLG